MTGVRLAFGITSCVMMLALALSMKWPAMFYVGIALALPTFALMHQLPTPLRCPRCGEEGTVRDFNDAWWERPPGEEEDEDG